MALLIPKLGSITLKVSRDITGNPKAVCVKRLGKKWSVSVTCDIGPAPAKIPVSKAVGIDLGLASFITLSDGSEVDNPRWVRQHEDRIARANRALARKQKRSRNRIRSREVLRRPHQRAADARRNFIHHISKWLIVNYDLIAYENLNIKGMVRSNLAKSILDAAWGELVWQLSYKAESAGRWAIPVNPKGTSIRCSACGADVPKTLAMRRHECSCGPSLGRDHNAALNVLALGMSAAGVRPS
jgi:putative transposase